MSLPRTVFQSYPLFVVVGQSDPMPVIAWMIHETSGGYTPLTPFGMVTGTYRLVSAELDAARAVEHGARNFGRGRSDDR